MIVAVKNLLLGVVIGLPSRALWLLRTKRDPLEVLQDAAERKYLRRRRPDTASDRPNKPRITACGASGIAYRF
jgi:hypothetical protein